MELPVLRLQPGDVAVNGGALKHHPPDLDVYKRQARRGRAAVPETFLRMRRRTLARMAFRLIVLIVGKYVVIVIT